MSLETWCGSDIAFTLLTRHVGPPVRAPTRTGQAGPGLLPPGAVSEGPHREPGSWGRSPHREAGASLSQLGTPGGGQPK
jgi:hypothetical protein